MASPLPIPFPLNDLIRQLFMSRSLVVNEDYVSFDAPDQDWRQGLSSKTDTVLDVYLVELYESLQYRSNERFVEAGAVERSPTRLNYRYLISAWSPITGGSSVLYPASEEAVLLYRVMQVLMDSIPLEPGRHLRPPGSPGDLHARVALFSVPGYRRPCGALPQTG